MFDLVVLLSSKTEETTIAGKVFKNKNFTKKSGMFVVLKIDWIITRFFLEYLSIIKDFDNVTTFNRLILVGVKFPDYSVLGNDITVKFIAILLQIFNWTNDVRKGKKYECKGFRLNNNLVD